MKIIPIGEGIEIRKRRAKAKEPKHTRLEVRVGHVVMLLGEKVGAPPGVELIFTPKLAREWASNFSLKARQAEDLASEALGGPPLLIKLRKYGLAGRVHEVAKKTGTFAAALCQPIAPEEVPSAAIIALWKELRGRLSLIDIGHLWGVSPSRVGRLTKR